LVDATLFNEGQYGPQRTIFLTSMLEYCRRKIAVTGGFKVTNKIVKNCTAGLIAIAISGVSSSCRPRTQSEDSETKFTQGYSGASHGHDKLTEISVKMANAAIRKMPGLRALPFGTTDEFYSEQNLNEPGSISAHPIIWGNLSVDIPATTRGITIARAIAQPNRDTSAEEITPLNRWLCDHYGLVDNSKANIDPAVRPRISECDAMPNRGEYQDAHFVRRWQGSDASTLETGYQACKGAQDRIKNATMAAIKSWNNHTLDQQSFKRRYNRFLSQYFLGIAAHTVQDAFSGAHVLRRDDNLKVISKICHYNEEITKKNQLPDICRHGHPFDPRDIIWKGHQIGIFTPTRYITGYISRLHGSLEGDLKNVTEEGQGAVMATTSYLITFANILDKLMTNDRTTIVIDDAVIAQHLNEGLNKFFNDDSNDDDKDLLSFGSGYLNCEKLEQKI
jgi:hypothetical protein